MRKPLYILLAAAMLAGCGKKQDKESDRAFVESVNQMSPEKGYAACLEQLRANPGEKGHLYYHAYYRAVDSDSVKHYAAFLDSVGRLPVSAPNRFYINTFKAMSAYMLKTSSLDSLVKAAAASEGTADILQQEVCSHLTARLLSESDPHGAYELQKKAVEAMRKGGGWRSAEVLAQAAQIGTELGHYPEAMDYLNEAQDTLDARGWDNTSGAYVLGNKANLYSCVEMHDSALNANRRAIELAKDNNYLLIDLYNFRAFIFDEKGMVDSAFNSLREAEKAVDRLKVPYAEVIRRYIRARRAVLGVKSHKEGENLSHVIPDLEAYVAGGKGLWEEQLALGYARSVSGDAGGLGLMEATRDSLLRGGEPALLLNADRHLIEAYTRAGRLADASRLYAETVALSDTLDLRHARYQSVASDLEHRVRAHIRENEELKEEISQEKGRVVWLTVACVLGAVLLVWGGIYIVLSHRLHERRRAIDSHQINTLIANQKTLNGRIEQLQAAAGEEKNWSELTPSSMSSDDTVRFRQSFTALYPDFLGHLHARCPGLTPGDETLCMLIRIGQTTDDIALTLGISRASVNSARYRIRKKMGLAKEDSLDDIVKEM